jgi:hypothetical protein
MNTLADPIASSISALHDFDFLHGRWRVRHQRLKDRLVGSADWQEFDGTCVNWATLDGAGNVDDNLLELPAGAYRAMSIRAFDPATNRWAIWWLDSRFPQGPLDPPVVGGFGDDGVGRFLADTTHDGRPIVMRFLWTGVASGSPRWEQAFSTDGGATWEVNWVMQFERCD